MDIILLEDINNLGHQNDIITVKGGYATNFLIPKKMAIAATESAKKVLAENKKQQAHKEAKLKGEAEVLAAQIENKKVKIGAKTSTAGKIFGSVNTIQVAEAINKKGFNIDRKQISLPEESIKETGKYIAKIRLHKEVIVELEFDVVQE